MKNMITLVAALSLSLLSLNAHAKKTDAPPQEEAQYEATNFNQLSNGAFADDLDGKWLQIEVSFSSLDTTYSKLVPWAKKKAAKDGMFFYVADPAAERVRMEIAPGVSLPSGYEGVFLDQSDRKLAINLQPGQKITLFGKAQKFSVRTTPMMPPETHTLLHVVRIQPSAL